MMQLFALEANFCGNFKYKQSQLEYLPSGKDESSSAKIVILAAPSCFPSEVSLKKSTPAGFLLLSVASTLSSLNTLKKLVFFAPWTLADTETGPLTGLYSSTSAKKLPYQYALERKGLLSIVSDQ